MLKTLKLIIIITIICIMPFSLLASCAETSVPMTVAELLELGEKYLLDFDYKQALIHFFEVLEIEQMNPRGYTGAVEAYIGLDRISYLY